MRASQDLVDGVDRAFGAPIAARYGEKAVQERIFRMPGLETGRSPEIVRRGVDGLSARERRHHVRRPVTKPERRHVDAGAVVRLEGKPRVEFGAAVSSGGRPVSATGRDLSTSARA